MKRPAAALITTLLALTTACGGGAETDDAAAEVRLDSEARAALQAADALADSAEEALAPLPTFTAADRRELRRHLNATHLASAREHGVSAVGDSADVTRLAAAGELVRLEDSTAYWIVRELDHSLPYVTPDARAMLMEIGQRFHQQLDSLGVPRYRFEISSVLRTAALQAQLRRGNSNASRGTSSHEHGTTVDLAYNAFTAPAADAPSLQALVRAVPGDHELSSMILARAQIALREVAEDRTAELKAILGDVLRDMQGEGKLRALHERAQPVYHLTLATDLPNPSRAAQAAVNAGGGPVGDRAADVSRARHAR